MPYNLIKKKKVNLIETAFHREDSLHVVFTLLANVFASLQNSDDQKRFKLWSCQKVCDALICLLYYIFISFGTKLHRQIVGIPSTNCASLIADLFLFCYDRDFMTSLACDTQAGVNKAFNSTSRYLDHFFILTIPILKEWRVKFILPNCS